jgi:predicted alpha-1,2-mannosidase
MMQIGTLSFRAMSQTRLPVRVAHAPWYRLAVAELHIALALSLMQAPAAATVGDAAVSDSAYAAVDPMIGTGGDGHTFPGATVPFGMIQLSPDTEIKHFKQSYKWAAGYRYEDNSILGFSHTHFSGSGHSDLGDVRFMPIAGDVKLDPGDSERPRSGYRSRFNHADERAEPGYYAVTLQDYGIRAELTANARVGLHRYCFPSDEPAHVLIDLRNDIYDYPGKVLWSRLRVRADGTVTGLRETRGWAPGRQLYFALRFSQPMQAHALHNLEETIEYKGFAAPGKGPTDLAQIEGKRIVGTFDFGMLKTPLVLKVAISSVSEDGAIGNLDHDFPGWDFDSARDTARSAWTQAFSVFDIVAPVSMRKSFYTALYHTQMAPNLSMDADGRYRGPDNAEHHADGFRFHSTYSLWDTYRAEHPLMTLIQPVERNNDFIRSFIASQQVSPWGILPIWQFQGQETWCMIGYHAVPVIADAYMKGIRGYPIEDALKAMIASATYAPYGGLGDYMKLGYVAIDREPEAASKTVEYAFDDWTIAQMARAMGRKDLAAQFDQRAKNWRNVFDAKTGFVRARRSDGRFNEPFDPAGVGYGSDYTEGNAWQYSWYEPQDVAGLIKLLGGDRKLVAKLDGVFDAKADPSKFAKVEDITGLIGYYAHGNEPSHHIAYLYDYAGEPWRTQQRLQQIMASQYAPRADGLAGNDDLGQMSAWFVFTALGFYPVAPASNEYVIGRPFLERATLNLPNGKRFFIIAENLNDEHPYIGTVTLNGKPLTRSFIRHEQIVAGGELRFVMQAQPNKSWASSPTSRPFSTSAYR